MTASGSAPPVAELFAVTPGRGDLAELLDRIPRLARGGVRLLLLRELELAADRWLDLALAVAGCCAANGVELWVARDPCRARSVSAHGVHLAEKSPSVAELAGADSAPTRYGLSLHVPVQRPVHEIQNAEHVFLSPVFPTRHRPGVAALGVVAFRRHCDAWGVRTFALGGIRAEHLGLLAAHGIRRIAAISFFFDSPDPEAAAREALAILGA